MTKIRTLISSLIVATLPLAAGAANLNPLQAHIVTLDNQTAVIYYTETDGRYEVVTTIASNDGNGTPIRHIASVAPGEKYTLAFENNGRSVLTMTPKGEQMAVQVQDEMQYVAAR